jgi:nucleoside-diphosphate-sugar epimerase
MSVHLDKIRNSLYHPVRSRVVYDVAASAFSSFLVSLILYLFLQVSVSLVFIFSFTVFFLVLCLFLGLYGRFRLGSIIQKSIILIFSSVFTGTILTYLGFSGLLTLLTALLTLTFSLMPRIFVNLNKLPGQISQEDSSKGYVLVTGGGGFIGTVLVEELLKKGYRVRVLDKFIYGEDVFKNIQNKNRLELIKGDITDPFILTRALINTRAVIHLAGIVGELASSLDENLTRHANIVSTRMLKESVKAFNIQRFIFASSTAVYPSGMKLLTEKDKASPSSIYTKTKLDSEKELLFDTHDSFHPTVLRISTAFGHSRKPKFDLVANLFIAQAVKKGEIHVINGSQWRSFIHVSDIADAFIKTLEAPLSKVSRQIFNVGDDSQRITLNNLAKLTQKIISNGKKISISKDVKRGSTNYIISYQKIRDTLNFSSRYSLEDGVLEVYDNFKKGSYKRSYNDPYYSSYEGARKAIKEFYTKAYRKKHYSTLFPDFQ